MNSRERLLQQAANVQPERKGKGLDSDKMLELHDQIARGVVDIGPFPDHTAPIEDIRYQGPSAEELGIEILARTNGHSITNRDLPELWTDS